ncbi:MFS transporter [Aeromicrobium sp. JJY06]|uniref:MFS transporter n=1 Tax=Aeromicrobium sp. JJY06 TaxID=3373478 RepID=UPI00376EB8EB
MNAGRQPGHVVSPGRAGARRARWEPVPLTLGIAGVSVAVSFTYYAVGTTLPVAVRDLGRPEAFGWTVAMFMGGNVFGVCVARWLVARLRPWSTEAIGIGVFLCGLVTAVAAPSIEVLVLARVLQGIGSGMDIVVVFLLIGSAYRPDQRPSMVALANYCLVIPGMVGPALAGWVATELGWRIVFMALTVMLVVAGTVLVVNMRRIDLPVDGVPLSYPAMGLVLIGGLVLLQLGGSVALGPAVLLVVGGLAIVIVAGRVLLPRPLLRFGSGHPGQFGMYGLLSACYFGGQLWLPLMLIEVRDLSAATAGLALLGAPLGWGIGSALQTRAAVGADGLAVRRRHVALGAGCTAMGMGALILAARTDLHLLFVLVIWTIAATGMGLAVSSLTVMLLDAENRADAAATSAWMQLVNGVSVAVALALGTVVHAGATDGGMSGATVFTLIFGACIALCAVAVIAAPALRHGSPADLERTA